MFCIAAECHLVYLFLSEWREASFAQHLADFIESYLIFKIIWIYHGCKGSANRRQYKIKKHFFIFIVEIRPVLLESSVFPSTKCLNC
ncbi:Uncharacterised protein [Segatella copri]|nr:Uncharacterised protein [Segatella copri]